MSEDEWLQSTDPGAMLIALQLWNARAGEAEVRSHPLWHNSRKLRLWACACVRQVWHLLKDPGSRRAVEVAELLADGADMPDDYARVASATLTGCLATSAANAARGAAGYARAAGCPPAVQCDLLRCVAGDPWRPVLADRAWCAPDVLALARAAYQERPGRECVACEGVGQRHQTKQLTGERAWMVCPDCGGDGRIADGALDAARLAVLADALEEAGCGVGRVHEYNDGGTAYWYNDTFPDEHHLTPDRAASHPLLDHLRGPGPHVRGCWVLDLLSGRD